MKIPQSDFVPCRRPNGFVVLLFLTLLAIMMILVVANSNALLGLHRETKQLEHRQIERLNTSQTNTVTAVALPSKPESK